MATKNDKTDADKELDALRADPRYATTRKLVSAVLLDLKAEEDEKNKDENKDEGGNFFDFFFGGKSK